MCQRRRLAGDVRQVDVDLVYAAILDVRGDHGHRRLEAPGVAAIFVEVGGQQDGVGGKCGCLHETHGGIHAQAPRRVVRRGRDAAPDVLAQTGEVLEVSSRPWAGTPSATDHHRQALELRVAEQFDGCVKGIHVQMSNATFHSEHRSATACLSGETTAANGKSRHGVHWTR